MSEQLHHPIPPDGDVGRDGTFGACEEGTGCAGSGEGVDGDVGRVEGHGGVEGRRPESVPGAARDEERARGAGGAVLLPRAEAGEEGLAEGAVRESAEGAGEAAAPGDGGFLPDSSMTWRVNLLFGMRWGSSSLQAGEATSYISIPSFPDPEDWRT